MGEWKFMKKNNHSRSSGIFHRTMHQTKEESVYTEVKIVKRGLKPLRLPSFIHSFNKHT